MRLAKPSAPSNDARYKIVQTEYLAHCKNIASILSATFDSKKQERQSLIDQYLVSVNTSTEDV